jgi:hypothetical protein
MKLVILDSAYKHGISVESIRSCLLNFRSDLLFDDMQPKRLFAGFDHLGVALEGGTYAILETLNNGHF